MVSVDTLDPRDGTAAEMDLAIRPVRQPIVERHTDPLVIRADHRDLAVRPTAGVRDRKHGIPRPDQIVAAAQAIGPCRGAHRGPEDKARRRQEMARTHRHRPIEKS